MIVTITPEKPENVENTIPSFFAVAPGGEMSAGTTPGEALDPLLIRQVDEPTLSPNEADLPLLFILRTGQGDRFFSNEQNARLQTLRAQHKSNVLSAAEAQELDDLLQAEIRASGERAAFLSQQINFPK